MEAVDEIHIGVACFTPHRLGTPGTTASVGMASRILGAKVCLDLGQPENNRTLAVATNHQLSQKSPRHLLGGTLVEVAWEHWRIGHGLFHLCHRWRRLYR